MPEVEVGRNRKGEFAVLKVTSNNPSYSVNEVVGLKGYRRIGVIHIPSSVKIYCGPIEKEILQDFMISNDNSVKKIKRFLG